MDTEVKLISNTENIFKTIWMVWQASRCDDTVEQMEDALEQATTDVLYDLFARILEEDIPLMEMIEFIFVLDNVSISLREQLVRHRIGTKIDGKIGIDIIPNLDDSTWWSQSMRILDMRSFAARQDFLIPESIQNVPKVSKRKVPLAIYKQFMYEAARVYSELVDMGIPMEDARNVLPLGASHRIVWKVNLMTLKRIMQKRGCWILQLGIWGPVIMGMISRARVSAWMLALRAPMFCRSMTRY